VGGESVVLYLGFGFGFAVEMGEHGIFSSLLEISSIIC
jgi:hypothetical protein